MSLFLLNGDQIADVLSKVPYEYQHPWMGCISNFQALSPEELLKLGFVPGVEDAQPEYNRTAYDLSPVYIVKGASVLVSWQLVAKAAPDAAASLEDARAAKRAEVNAARERKLAAGFEHAGYRWDSDQRSRENLSGTVAALAAGVPLPSGFTWRSEDNRDVPMTPPELFSLGAAMLAHGNGVYRQSWDLKAQIDVSTDPSKIEVPKG